MRVTYIGVLAVSICAGCAAGRERVVNEPLSGSAGQEEPAAVPQRVEAEPPIEPHEPIAAPPAMTEEEIQALVSSVVADGLARQEEQLAAAEAAQSQKLAVEARAEAEAARAAEKIQQEKAQRQAAEAARAARQDDEQLARFLLLSEELERVERIKKHLRTESIWELTRQDLDFAAAGIAAPLLHDTLHEAAERYDPDIALDALAHRAELTPDEKIQLATMPPVERRRLLMFTDQFENAKPSVEADRYVREYINRYPFMRKILLAHLRPKE